MIKRIINFIKALFGFIDEFEKESKNVEPIEDKDEGTEDVVKIDYITLFARAVQEFEGWYPGSKSYRNNNPGNIRSVSGRFMVFSTYGEGFDYLRDYIYRAATGRHKAYKPSFTIRQFVETYAPPVENSDASIRNYTNHIINKLGITSETRLKDLV